MEAAARVKPVAGSLPQNHRFAGGEYTIDDVIRAKVEKDPNLGELAIQQLEERGLSGVQFTEDGFVDFEPLIYRDGGVAGDVRIELAGSREADFAGCRSEADVHIPGISVGCTQLTAA